jgi:hypothetical protein
VIGEGIHHPVAGAEACGKKAARGAPPILAAAFRIVDRPRRDEELAELFDRRGVQSAERRKRLLQSDEVALARHRQSRERLARLDLPRVNVRENAGEPRRALLGMRDEPWQLGHELRFAPLRGARLQLVKVIHSQRLRRR